MPRPLKIVATMMVRDEIDIVSAMIEHHLDQGVDQIIVTDNASVDGTRDVLAEYARVGAVELHDDPEHRKQQHAVVTAMARRARTRFAADWVINADADEFFVPVDKSRSLREVLQEIPLALGSFKADVTNLVGPPAESGAGVGRLRWRDGRSDRELRSIGINAQPTANAIHRGDPTVVVAQGNHFVSVESHGQPDPSLAIEVLHVPWRSWAQLERKVENAGKGYEASPDLQPSRNHHGMADFRRHRGGRLKYAYLLRSPTRRALDDTSRRCFVLDPWLADHLRDLGTRAVLADHLRRVLDEPPEGVIPEQEHEQGARLGRQFSDLENELRELRHVIDHHRRHVHHLTAEVRDLRRGPASTEKNNNSSEEALWPHLAGRV
jgi:hypothetical protein